MKLVIGTAGWRTPYGALRKGMISKRKIREILHTAELEGIAALDTSPDYGDAELIIGQCFWKQDIATKIVFTDERETDLQIKLKHSMERLRVNSLNVVFIHNWDDLHQRHKIRALEFMKEMKDIGIVKDIGISTYSIYEIKEILSSKLRNVIIQVNLNILDQRIVELGVEKWQAKILQNEVELWGRSIFLQGILLGSSKENPFSNHPDLLRFWRYCLSIGSDPYDVCLAFPGQLGFIDAIVVGINNVKEIHGLLKANNGPSTKYDFASIASIASSDSNLIDPRRWR